METDGAIEGQAVAERPRRSILLRASVLAWIVITLSLGMFMALMIPRQKNILIDRLKARAEAIAASVEQVTAAYTLVEDYGSVADNAFRVVQDRPAVRYLAITRKDGLSLVYAHSAWRWDRSIEIAVTSTGQLPPILADIVQIQQVLLNLLINARDALESNPAAGRTPRIGIEVEAVTLSRTDPPVHPDARPGEYVRLSVSDNGPGMDAATQDRIFEPFFTTKRTGEGTGLGLATVYGIVKQHDGWIDVRSRVDEGTVFTLYLPAADQPAPPEEEAIEDTLLPGGTETLLVIDDEQHVREMLTTHLERRGYQVLIADNGRDGLDLFNRYRERIALTLLDISMPEMSGRAVLEQMLSIDPDARVVIITGYMADPLRYTGARATIQKPFRGNELLHTVRAVLDADP